jgi:microcystin-dependent protein
MTASPYLASIALFAGNFAIKNYMYCQGQTLAINQNQALAALLGNNYGGDVKTNFMLPNLSGAAIAGPSNDGVFPLFHRVGTAAITLTSAQMPAHIHGISPSAASGIGIAANSSAQAITPTPGATEVFAASNTGGSSVNAVSVYAPATTAPVALSVSGTVTGNGPSAVAGGSQPVSVMQPSLVMGYQICTAGFFPPRP